MPKQWRTFAEGGVAQWETPMDNWARTVCPGWGAPHFLLCWEYYYTQISGKSLAWDCRNLEIHLLSRLIAHILWEVAAMVAEGLLCVHSEGANLLGMDGMVGPDLLSIQGAARNDDSDNSHH